MKKLIISVLALATLLPFSGCKDEDYNDKYLDPSKVTETQIPFLMTGTFLRMRDYSTFGYYRYYCYDIAFMGKFAQTSGYATSETMYDPGHALYAEGQNGAVYLAFMNYKKLQKDFDALSEGEKEATKAYLLATRIHLYDWFLACVDIFGDMPFSEACTLPFTGDLVESYAPYDKAEDIYSTILDELREAAEAFADPNLYKHNKFDAQDFVCSGDFNKWARYANSLRLRAAIRISQFGSLTQKGKDIIKEIIENPTAWPLVDSNEHNIMLRNDHTGELNLEGGSGLSETSGSTAAGSLIDRMLSHGNWQSRRLAGGGYEHVPETGKYYPGIDDPRLPLLYTMRGRSATGASLTGNYTRIVEDPAYADSLFFIGTDYKSTFLDPDYFTDMGTGQIISGGFFRQNTNFEHVQITASEVLFCIAEAYHRGWGVARDDVKSKEYFKQAVIQSIKLYYHWNDINSGNQTQKVTIPNDEVLNNFAEARWETSLNPNLPYDRTDPKIDAILTQKWVHWGFFFPRQSWSQIRRTGLPKLIYPTSNGLPRDWAPDRWMYCKEERNYNPYYPGEENDTFYGKIFWADPRGMRHSVYSNGTWTDQWND